MSWIGCNNVFSFSMKSLLFQPLPIFHSRKLSIWKEEKETCLTAALVSLCLENCMSVATKRWISLVLFRWFLSLGAVVADLDLTLDVGSLFFRYRLPFKSSCYSAEFNFLNSMSVRASQVLLRHGPDHLFSENKLAKETQVDTSELTNFRSISFNAFQAHFNARLSG